MKCCNWILAILFGGVVVSSVATHDLKGSAQTLSSNAAPALTGRGVDDVPLPDERAKWLKVQVFLDRAHFSPGVIDGHGGEFTRKALQRYERASGRTPSGGPESILADLGDVPVVTRYRVTASDQTNVAQLGNSVMARAEADVLLYETLLEYLAERFHSDRDLVRELNPGLETNGLQAGTVVTVPNVEPFVWFHAETNILGALAERKEARKNAESSQGIREQRVLIDVTERMLELRDGDELVACFPITPGSADNPAPEGLWKIQGFAPMPTFRWDEAMLEEGWRSDSFAMLPPGPNSPVGVVWMELNKDGVGLHGTSEPETIGRSESHGCIRLTNWDAVDLAMRLGPGTEVQIR